MSPGAPVTRRVPQEQSKNMQPGCVTTTLKFKWVILMQICSENSSSEITNHQQLTSKFRNNFSVSWRIPESKKTLLLSANIISYMEGKLFIQQPGFFTSNLRQIWYSDLSVGLVLGRFHRLDSLSTYHPWPFEHVHYR